MHTLAILAIAAANPVQDASCISDWKRIAYHGFNVADKAITHRVTQSDNIREANPLWKAAFGKRISLGEAAAMTLISSAGYELVLHGLKGRCRATQRFQSISLVLQGGVVAANLRFVF